MIQMALQMLQQNGGIEGLLAKFQQAGMGQQAQSWIGTGQNMPISPDALSQIFGQGQLATDRAATGHVARAGCRRPRADAAARRRPDDARVARFRQTTTTSSRRRWQYCKRAAKANGPRIPLAPVARPANAARPISRVQSCRHGRPSTRQPLTTRCPCAFLSPSKPADVERRAKPFAAASVAACFERTPLRHRNATGRSGSDFVAQLRRGNGRCASLPDSRTTR